MTSRREFLVRSCIGFLGLFAGQFCSAATGDGNKPNVLLLFTDDQRFDTIGALGNPHIKTPALDQLAERSLVFRNAYNFGGNAGAVCIPARNMLMTGNTFFRFDAGAKDRGRGPTFPKVMKAAGYETFYREKSGKANLPHIQKQFDYFEDINMVDALSTGYAAKGIVNDAIEYLKEGRDRDKPFFMYLGFPCPHDPRWAAREFRELYDPDKIPIPPNYLPVHKYDMGMMTIRDECLETWPRTETAVKRHLHDYYSLISSMDHDISRLLDTLDDLELTENTLVIFTSDQGLAMGSHGLMGKQSVYEDVQKVPLLFSGPGIQKGDTGAFAYIHDLLPTVCELIGTEVPGRIDGKSLAPVIKGDCDGVRDRVMLAFRGTQRSIRDERWKLICLPEIDRKMVFDLEKDPWETKDLSSDPKSKKQLDRMMDLLVKEQKIYGDELPLTSKNPKPAVFVPPEKTKIKYRGGLAPGVE